MLHLSLLRSARRAPSVLPTTPRFGRLLAVATGVALTATLASPITAPSQARTVDAVETLTSSPIVLGASGDVQGLSNQIGRPLATHNFGKLTGPVLTGRLVNLDPESQWAAVAAAPPGSAIHNNLVRWATGLRARATPVMLAFNHEPEASGNTGKGSASDFIRAWRKVVSLFRAQGANNVKFTWTMTAYSFRVNSADRRYAEKWYPGDEYVDFVGADAYNWVSCGPGRGSWTSLAEIAGGGLNFAKRHGKKLVLPEWGSQADSRRAGWLRDAHNWLKSNQASIAGAFYYNPTVAPRSDCRWHLNTASEFDAFGDMARDTAFTNS